MLGIHTNMPGAVPPDLAKALAANAPAPAGLAADEKHAYEQVAAFYKHLGYAILLGSRPQTLTALADSPVGLAAFMIDHDDRSLEMITRVVRRKARRPHARRRARQHHAVLADEHGDLRGAPLLGEQAPVLRPLGITIPVAVSAFPDELYQCPRSWAEKAFSKLIHYNKLPKGGHFAAWEQPQFLCRRAARGLQIAAPIDGRGGAGTRAKGRLVSGANNERSAFGNRLQFTETGFGGAGISFRVTGGARLCQQLTSGFGKLR